MGRKTSSDIDITQAFDDVTQEVTEEVTDELSQELPAELFEGVDEELAEAMRAVAASPGDRGAWERLEDCVSTAQEPDIAARVFQSVLNRELPAHMAASVGRRAARFLEEWFGEESEVLLQILERVLELNPGAEWAFQRLTVVHTVAGRWEELLGLYDKAIAAADSKPRKITLLDEAANVARDFAQYPDQAIEYLTQLVELKSDDSQLVASLERLLERQQRWDDLIALWRRNIDTLGRADAHAVRRRIATCFLEKLDNPEEALKEIDALIRGGASGDDIVEQLELISGSDEAPAEVRRSALALLKSRYEAENRATDVVRTLDTALELADHVEAIALHREAGQRLMAQERYEEAFGHFARLLSLEPTAVDARQRLEQLASRTDNHIALAEALEAAAGMCEEAKTRVSLRLEAAETRRSVLGDPDGAIGLYQTILDESEATEVAVLRACRRLHELLETTGRSEELLEVLEVLADKEPETNQKRAVIARAARLADSLDAPDKSLGLWQRRLEIDQEDIKAHDAIVAILEREKKWAELIDALRRRSQAAPTQGQRRSDLVRVARIQDESLSDLSGAIDTWRSIAESFGDDSETVDALADLLTRAERSEELYSLLDDAAARESAHVAQVLVRLGDAHRDQSRDNKTAMGFYERALRIDPSHVDALAGLHSLLEDADQQGTVAEILCDAYQATKSWPEFVGLLEHRLAAASDAATKVDLFRTAAAIQETELDHGSAALGLLRRAFVVAPTWESLEADILRLAEATGDWTVAAVAFRDGAEAVSEKKRKRHLRMEEGRIAETLLGDPVAASEAYLEAYNLNRSFTKAAVAVVRTAAKARRWDRVAVTVIAFVTARKTVVEDMVEAMETAADDADSWPELVGSLDGALGAVTDLDRRVGKELDLLLASWHEHRRKDYDAAESAMLRALSRGEDDEKTLSALANVQRRAPGRPLFDTLVRFADFTVADDNIDPLVEAARLAADPLSDSALEQRVLERLYRDGARLWRRGDEAKGDEQPEQATLYALDQLADLYESQGEHAKAVALLVDGARLPIEMSQSLDYRRRAGRLAAGPLADKARTIMLYRSILEDAPNDIEAIRELSQVFEKDGRMEELLPLRHHELTLCEDSDRRLDLRLDIARIVKYLEVGGGRLEALRANLEESPGHHASIHAVVDMLDEAKRYSEMAELLENQAARLEELEKLDQSASLWAKVATVVEDQLGDVERAIKCHRRVLELSSSTEALKALARLFTEREEHSAAARWLERLHKETEGDERTPIALRLAKARLKAGQQGLAVECLEAALHEAPFSRELRDLLASQYRETEALEPLARLLTEAAPFLDDKDQLRDFALESANIYGRLGMEDRSIEVLERATTEVPEDRTIRRMLATGLLAADRVDEAKGMLEELIDQFGRRRNAERAAVHLELARVLKAEGDLEGALAQLDLASKMDVRNTRIAGMLGALAREAGQLDRAEQAFRALLMVTRRQPPKDETEIGPAEVLFELYRLAKDRGQEDQAEELLMNSLQTASQNAAESRRFKRAMVERGQPDIALKALESRVESAPSGDELAHALVDMAEVLEKSKDKPEEAFETRLRAIEQAPQSFRNHDATLELARRLGQVSRYVDELRLRVSRARRMEDSTLSAKLLLRLAEVLERDQGDLEGAAEACARAEECSDDPVVARLALIRIANSRGDVTEETRLLELLVRDEGVPEEARIDARYRLAEVRLATPSEGGTHGLDTLEEALKEEPIFSRAAEILKKATTASPDDEGRLALYGKVARSSKDGRFLLDYLEKRSCAEDVSLEELEEGSQLARKLEEPLRRKPLLEKACAIAETSGDGVAAAIWAPLGLTEINQDQGDYGAAVQWMRKAAEATDDPDLARDRWLAAARLAAEAGDREEAANIFEEVRAKDPADPKVWEPLFDLFCDLGDEQRLDRLVAETLETITDRGDRNSLRLRHVRFLLSGEGREKEAADVLRGVLDEEPDHTEAATLLADVFERIGYDEELADLLRRQLDSAQEQEDAESIRELSLRLGKLLEKVDRDEAMAVYRTAVKLLPEDSDVPERLLGLLGPDDDPREQVTLMERPLLSEAGDSAAKLALSLADEWATLEDKAGVKRVLELGYERCPEHEGLRGRLEQGYREHEQWEPLTDFLTKEAQRLDDPNRSVALLREAATIHHQSRSDLKAAAKALVRARKITPMDPGLLRELANIRVVADAVPKAVMEVGEVLEHVDDKDQTKPELLSLRAELRLGQKDFEQAVADLEESYALAGAERAQELADGLEAERLHARSTGLVDVEQRATFRLVEVARENQDLERAQEVLGQWIDAHNDDKDALYILRDINLSEERWDGLATTCERLLELEEGEPQVDAAIRLADAWDKMGEPAAARRALERVYESQPAVDSVRERLKTLYEAIGATSELATMIAEEARTLEDEDRKFKLLRRAGELFFESEGGAGLAVAVLEEAARIKPDDHETAILLVDAYIDSGRHADAVTLLEQAIAAKGGRRSPQLADLQHRMAHLAEAAGDKPVQMQWLNVALDSDRRNGYIAAELAPLAMELGEFELSLKALRVVTVGRSESPMTRAQAFLMQGRIAHAKGEQGPALAWARRAKSEDPELKEAADFIKELEG